MKAGGNTAVRGCILNSMALLDSPEVAVIENNKRHREQHACEIKVCGQNRPVTEVVPECLLLQHSPSEYPRNEG